MSSLVAEPAVRASARERLAQLAGAARVARAGIVWAPADGATPWGGWNVSSSAGAGSAVR